MAYDVQLETRCEQSGALAALIRKPMFGGVAWFSRGHFVAGIHKEALVVRVGETRANAAIQGKQGRAMDITGKPMRGWLILNPEEAKTPKRIAAWIEIAMTFVDALPEKPAKVSVKKTTKPNLLSRDGAPLNARTANAKRGTNKK